MLRIFGGLLAVVAGPAWAAEHTVTMAGSHYQPETLRIRVGDTVRFTNDDTVDHTVFAPTIGFAFDLGRQKPGEARSYRFGRAGRIEVECVNHGHMLMTVEVTP